MTKCQVCDYPLDRRWRCASCVGVTPEDLEAVKYETVYWCVCPDHGAFEATGKPYTYYWDTPDPRDRRKKIHHHNWTWRCPLDDLLTLNHATVFKEVIPRREEVYKPIIEERLGRWI
jgi:hypothetical protein